MATLTILHVSRADGRLLGFRTRRDSIKLTTTSKISFDFGRQDRRSSNFSVQITFSFSEVRITKNLDQPPFWLLISKRKSPVMSSNRRHPSDQISLVSLICV